MPVSYNIPSLNIIKQFTNPKLEELWLPGLFEDRYYNGMFPIDFTGDLREQTEFSKKNSDLDDFTISLKRYYLFLYCLKSRPFLFESASKLINYNKDEFLYTPELADYLSNIQTNKIKNKVNSSLTIELVKKYAIDKGLDFFPQRLSDFFDVANTEDYINNISRTINSVIYESVIKHTLYENLKTTSFNFKEGSASGWTEKAINIPSGKFEYFIDVEGGPDNKSYPVVCVLTKRISKDTKEDILQQTNSYVSNLFSKKIGNECLARIVGEPDQFENNYKSVPILKGKKDDTLYYNSICVVYDLSRIILSESVDRNYDLNSLIEISLGFFTEYTVEINKIDDLILKSDYLSNFMLNYFSEDSFSNIFYKISAKNKHVNEIYKRINLFDKGEISKSISQPIKLNRTNLVNAFNSYVQLIINSYKEARLESQYLTPFSEEDLNVYLHFDSFLNLLAITTIPKEKKQVETTKEFSPFEIEKFNNFDLDSEKNYFSDEFYGKYLNLIGDVKNYSGRRVCLISKTLERLLYNTFDDPSDSFYVTDNLTSDKFIKKDINLLSKINSTLPNIKFNYGKEDFFIDENLIDKTIKIANLITTYRENKYQSVALQTMAFYLINAEKGEGLLKDEPDVKRFGEVYHYPILSAMASEEVENGNISLDIEEIINKKALDNFPDFKYDVPQEILILSRKTISLFETILGTEYSLEEIGNDVNNLVISNIPCYADIVDIINEFKSAENARDIVIAVMDILSRIPIVEIISALIEKLLNELGILDESRDPCKPLPTKFSVDPNDLFNSIEYLKDLYSSFLNPSGLIQGILSNIPKLPTLDFWRFLIEKILLFLLKIGIDFVLKEVFNLIRPYLEKLCALDFEIFRPPFFEENNQEALFSPNILADSFGSPAGSGGPLYDVQLFVDINTLIDLSQISTREYVYNKFTEEFSIDKTQENFSEISKFLSDISPAIDLYELASLLRGVGVEYTINTLIDSIKLTEFKYKSLFLDKDDVTSLFIFLGKHCDYRICYDILSRSLQKYVGNICGPQQSRKNDYELILQNTIGVGDFKNVIRDQVLDLEKQLDSLCSNQLTVDFNLLKDGPKLLANSLTPYMVMSFSTIVEFQKNIYEFERGFNLTDAQRNMLGTAIFSVNTLNNPYAKYNTKLSLVSSKYSGFPVIGSNLITPLNLVSISKNLKDQKYIADFNSRKSKINSYLKQNNIQIDDYIIEDKIRSELFVNPMIKFAKLSNLLNDRKVFDDAYKSIVYSVNYLENLRNEITEQIENATNLDMQDDMDSFMSYINKIKEE